MVTTWILIGNVNFPMTQLVSPLKPTRFITRNLWMLSRSHPMLLKVVLKIKLTELPLWWWFFLPACLIFLIGSPEHRCVESGALWCMLLQILHEWLVLLYHTSSFLMLFFSVMLSDLHPFEFSRKEWNLQISFFWLRIRFSTLVFGIML